MVDIANVRLVGVKLPCGRKVDLPEGLDLDYYCLDICPYVLTCGPFSDWFIKNHREVVPLRGP